MPEVPPFLWSDAGTFSAPKKYTVPGAGEVMPYTATATYVNASGQAILPALRIKSAEGALLALTFPVGQTVADGSSSEVTFVPPFGSATGSGAASGTTLSYAIFNGNATTGGSQHWTDVTTNDSSTFSVDGTDDTLAVISTAGFYLVFVVPSVGVLTSPYTVPNNTKLSVVETTGGAAVAQDVLVIRNQTAATLPSAGSNYAAGMAIWPYFATSPPWKMRVSFAPTDVNVALGGRLRFVKIA